MDPDYGRAYKELYQRHWWWRAREELLVDVLRRIRPDRRDLRLLDVGCGAGLFFERLREFGTVQGVEPDPALVAMAALGDRARIHAGELSDLPAGPGFDLILILDVLEHLADAPGVLARALAMLRPEGRVVVTVPALPALWTHHDVLNHHLRRYTRRSLHELIENAGGRTQELRYFFHWAVGAKLVVRAFEAVRQPAGVPRVPVPAVNRALYGLSRIEARLIGPLRLPFGSSLLAVCSRER